METLRVKAHVGHDGILTLVVPIGIIDVDCDVTIAIEPTLTQEEWIHFIDKTAGSLADTPIERLSQGEFDKRDPIE